jgi:hypothetical protein
MPLRRLLPGQQRGHAYYAKIVREMYEERGSKREIGGTRAIDYVPHDARITEWGSDKTRIEQMLAKGLSPHIATQMSLEDGINAVFATLPDCEFDEEGCSEGIKVLKAYRREWDEDAGRWSERPRHDWASEVPMRSATLPPPIVSCRCRLSRKSRSRSSFVCRRSMRWWQIT